MHPIIPFTHVIVAGRYVIKGKVLLDHKESLRGQKPVIVLTDTSTGHTGIHSLQEIERLVHYMMTGEHPSYPLDPDPSLVSGLLDDSFTAEIGVLIERPEDVAEYVVHAEYGPYKSNEVRITVRNEL